MTKMGGTHHIKRHPAPVFWPIHRKEYVWTVKPKAGPHPAKRCIPLLILIRDVFNLAKTKREAKRIISEKQIIVDGRFVVEYDYPIGLMDVVEIPKMKVAYRVLPSPKNILSLHKIKGKEKSFKLFKITGKTSVKGGRLQLNLHDGQNILLDQKRPRQPKDQEYETTDVLKISLSKKKILEHTKIRKSIPAIIIDGKNVGVWGKITRIKKGRGPHPTIVTLESVNGKKIQTPIKYVFAIGEEKPWISLPEGKKNE